MLLLSRVQRLLYASSLFCQLLFNYSEKFIQDPKTAAYSSDMPNVYVVSTMAMLDAVVNSHSFP